MFIEWKIICILNGQTVKAGKAVKKDFVTFPFFIQSLDGFIQNPFHCQPELSSPPRLVAALRVKSSAVKIVILSLHSHRRATSWTWNLKHSLFPLKCSGIEIWSLSQRIKLYAKESRKRQPSANSSKLRELRRNGIAIKSSHKTYDNLFFHIELSWNSNSLVHFSFHNNIFFDDSSKFRADSSVNSVQAVSSFARP